MVILNRGSESEVLAGLECLQERIAVETKSRTIPLDIAAGMPAAVSFCGINPKKIGKNTCNSEIHRI